MDWSEMKRGNSQSLLRRPYGNSLLKVCTTEEERNKKGFFFFFFLLFPLTKANARWKKGDYIGNRSASDRNSLKVKAKLKSWTISKVPFFFSLLRLNIIANKGKGIHKK